MTSLRRRLCRWFGRDEPEMVPQKVRDASHRLNNEVFGLRASLHELEKQPDPIGNLVRAMQDRDGGSQR